MKNTTLFIGALFIFLIPSNAFSQTEKSNAIITMEYQKTDSTHVINFEVTDIKKNPIKDVTLNVFAKRMFGMMNLGDILTDSIGKASIAFSNKFPGSDSLANIFVVVKIEDNAFLNDTSAQIVLKSKIPYQPSEALERSTFASLAPIWLILTFSILFGGVWLVYFRVLWLISKIKKAGNIIS